jgi:hypothetical protein
MNMNAFVAALLANAIPGWSSLGRRSWCMKQRRLPYLRAVASAG